MESVCKYEYRQHIEICHHWSEQDEVPVNTLNTENLISFYIIPKNSVIHMICIEFFLFCLVLFMFLQI